MHYNGSVTLLNSIQNAIYVADILASISAECVGDI